MDDYIHNNVAVIQEMEESLLILKNSHQIIIILINKLMKEFKLEDSYIIEIFLDEIHSIEIEIKRIRILITNVRMNVN